jgi:hypothetical protein
MHMRVVIGVVFLAATAIGADSDYNGRWDLTTGAALYKVEVYARIRRAVQVDGMSIRQAAREFGVARKTIRKMLQFSLPPGYERKKPVERPKLGPWLGSSTRSWWTTSRSRKSSGIRRSGFGIG